MFFTQRRNRLVKMYKAVDISLICIILGSVIHHVTYCLELAYFFKRRLVIDESLNKFGVANYIKPFFEKCTENPRKKAIWQGK